MRSFLPLVLIAASGVARAEAEPASPAALGIALDGGVPDGLAAGLAWRPVRFVRLEGGVTYNVLGFGLRAGVTAVPLDLALAPTLRAEYGHVFSADAGSLASRFATLSSLERSLLDGLAYDTLTLQLGVESSPARGRVVLFLRAGLTWFWAAVPDFAAKVQASNPGTRIEAQDPRLSGTAPSVGLGAVIFLW
jgi:hypothetical protein